MKTKTKFLILLALISYSFSYGQLQEKINYENVINGSIIKDGKEIAGYIRKMGWATLGDDKALPAPWEFQSDIKFIPKDVFENTPKIKNKMYESYSAKDIEGYKYDTVYYESVKYSDMSAVGTGMIAKKIFMRKLLTNKISLYQYFSSPPAIGEVTYLKSQYAECAKPSVVYKVGDDGKLKLVNNMNVTKELADCPAVVQKYEKGEYKIAGDGETQSKGSKLLNKTIFRGDVRLLAIEDYNQSCK